MNWQRLDSQIVYENDWMRVLEDQVINPGGGRNAYGHIQFKNRAIAIVPIDDEGFTWLVGQQRYTLGEYSWELPMGGAPEGEDPLDAAKRELKEETGLTADRWAEVMHLHTSNSITNELGIVFTAESLSEGEPEFEETEDLEIRRVSLQEAVSLIGDGTITDGISVAALLYVYGLRNGSLPTEYS